MSQVTRRHLFKWSALAAAAYPFGEAAANEPHRQERTDSLTRQDRALPHYSLLPAGTVKPQGWIYEQMATDLEKGIAGNYDKIDPHVTKNVFVTKNVGTGEVWKHGNDLYTPDYWWLGEQEGYWKDAVIRLAFLTGNKYWIDRSRQWVEAIIEAQDSDGYIGVYDKTSRFQQSAGNEAELWTQARIFQGMLGYYEFTRNRRVLLAVERAVQLTLKSYSKTYFGRPGRVNAGMTHGVGFGDTLEYLYRLTGNEIYGQALVWLYRDFCEALPTDDSAILQLLNPGLNWTKHAPHLVEGLPLPFYSHVLLDDELMGIAARNALEKWRRCTTPGGGIVGDALESVARLYGTGATYCEYCGITEGLIAANRILAWSGDLSLGDIAERRSLNAAQGARTHPVNIAVAYLSRDNQDTTDQRRKIGNRILYSARHTVASCCALNSMRLMPYYVEGMWLSLKDEPGLLANLYGPCQLETTISGTVIKIKEETRYPFEDSVTFHIDPARPFKLTLHFRVPETCHDVEVNVGEDAVVEKRAGVLVIQKQWKPRDVVRLTFHNDVRWATSHDNEYYYLRGALVYGISFPQHMVVQQDILDNGVDSGFCEYLNTPIHTMGWNYRIRNSKEENYGFAVVSQDNGDMRYPWAHPPIALVGTMLTIDDKEEGVTLIPMGCSNLRRVTFPKDGDNDISIQDKTPWTDSKL